MNYETTNELISRKLSPLEAERKAGLFHRAASVLEGWAGRETPEWVRCYVPGRIEVLGKHTDYAGGRSLVCAVERGICAVAAPRSGCGIRIADVLRGQECEFMLSPDLEPRSENWAIYAKTVARRIARNFSGPLSGMNMVFASDLPRAAGLSSSSALLIAIYNLLERFNDLRSRPEFVSNIRNLEEQANYLGCVENGQSLGTLAGDAGVGTSGGSEDHTAILCSRPGAIRQYRFCATQFEREVPLRPEFVFALGVSGVAADKTGSAREKYNRAAGAAQEILKNWKEATGRTDASLFEAVTHSSEAPDIICELLRTTKAAAFSSHELQDRFDQFFEESTRIVPGGAETLDANDLDAFGEYVDRSQALAEQKLGNQIPQTIELARSARGLGAMAASAFGAGFGGSVWAMVRAEQAAEFVNRWQDHYRKKFSAESEKSAFFVSGAGPAACLF